MHFAQHHDELNRLLRSGKLQELAERCHAYLTELKQRLDDKHLEVAFAYEDLGRAYYELRAFPTACEQYQQALKLEQELLGKESIHCARCLSNIGRLYSLMNDDAGAELHLNRAREIISQLPKARRRGMGTVLINLGIIELNRHNCQKARKLFVHALQHNNLYYGSEHPKAANALFHLGSLEMKNGNLVAAEKVTRKLLRIYRKASYTHNPSYAAGLVLHADICKALRKTAEERALLNAALKIMTSGHLCDDPRTTAIQDRLAAMLMS